MMKMHDYAVSYKRGWRAEEKWPDLKWDLLLSAFNSSDRVREVFNLAPAGEKHWFISPEYEYAQSELPKGGHCFVPDTTDEAAAVGRYFEELNLDLNKSRLCIDITGFM